MKQPVTLVIATRNKGKTSEIRALLKNYPVIIKSLDDFGPIPDVKEDGDTFDDNAYKKASFTSRILGIPALADDSGLGSARCPFDLVLSFLSWSNGGIEPISRDPAWFRSG